MAIGTRTIVLAIVLLIVAITLAIVIATAVSYKSVVMDGVIRRTDHFTDFTPDDRAKQGGVVCFDDVAAEPFYSGERAEETRVRFVGSFVPPHAPRGIQTNNPDCTIRVHRFIELKSLD